MRRSAPLACLALVAAAGLAFAGKAEDVAKYVDDLKSKDAGVRAKAATEIGNIGSVKSSLTKKAVKPMVELLKDGDDKVRAAAASAVCKLDEPKTVVPAMIEQLKAEKKQPVQVALIEGLAVMGAESKAALPTLKELQGKKENMQVANAAGRAMRQINSKE